LKYLSIPGTDLEPSRVALGTANYGSGQFLFMQDRFVLEALDLPLEIRTTVKKMSNTFGNTLTSTLWRLVEEGHRGQPVFGVISPHPRYQLASFDPQNPCRYFIESPAFRARFGNTTEVGAFDMIRSYITWGKKGPLGEGEVKILDANGELHRFRMESFSTTYDVLTLGVHLGPASTQVVKPARKHVRRKAPF